MKKSDTVSHKAITQTQQLLLSHLFRPLDYILISMRPWQWTKNAVIALPFLFTVNLRWHFDDLGLVMNLVARTTVALVLFCLLSGMVYIINDLVDRENDRLHGKKRQRPLASGKLSPAIAKTAAVLGTAAVLAMSFLLNVSFGLVSLLYFGMNLGYSLAFKKVILLDVLLVSLGYVVRLWAGSVAVVVPTSPWLYMTIGLGALFIAVGKRYSEMASSGENAVNQRGVLELYSSQFLSQLVIITATLTLIAYSLYTFTATNLPANHAMMATIPFVVFGIFRYLYLINTHSEAESPELLFVKDVPLVLDIFSWALSVVVLFLLNR